MRYVCVVSIRLQLLSELCFKNLAVVVLRQTVQESIVLGTLEARNVLQTKIVQLLLTGLATGLKDYESHDLFSPVWVKSTDNRGLKNRIML